MAKKATIPAFGSPLGGGFFAGEIIINGERFALVVAPKAEGEKMELQYKKKNRDTADGTHVENQGLANSDLINDDNHPAAQFCRSLKIGGFDDWYLPSRDELMTIWMALGPRRSNTPDLFREDGTEAFNTEWYWSSTEHAQYSSNAWFVEFINGYQYSSNKNYNYEVRAVRRLKL
jgi:hypothetical protein